MSLGGAVWHDFEKRHWTSVTYGVPFWQRSIGASVSIGAAAAISWKLMPHRASNHLRAQKAEAKSLGDDEGIACAE
ncbi:unnamed protein product [Prunus armeniaca]